MNRGLIPGENKTLVQNRKRKDRDNKKRNNKSNEGYGKKQSTIN